MVLIFADSLNVVLCMEEDRHCVMGMEIATIA